MEGSVERIRDHSGGGIKRIFGFRSRMRDGIALSSDIWLPNGGGQYPLLLVRTPYLKTLAIFNFPKVARFFAAKGYAVAVQDVRGRGDSEGKFDYYFQEGNDGYDSIEWLAAQPWCNGRVGMMGASYLGTVQWLAARARPPHLVCIASTAAAGDYLNECPYIGGALMQQFSLTWPYLVSGTLFQSNIVPEDWPDILNHRPLLTSDEVLGRKMPLYRQWLEHPTLDDYWRRIQLTEKDFRYIDIPALHVTGWFDGNQAGAMHYWGGMTENSPAAEQQYLVAGPWNHLQTCIGGGSKKGEMEFTTDSIIDVYQLHLEFFERYLKQTTQTFEQPRVRLYVTGRNAWRQFETYPIASAETQRLYLSSQGKANSLLGNGKLVQAHASRESQDQYNFDPRHPVPLDFSAPGEIYAADRRAIEHRDDVLVYTGEPLMKPLEVIGKVVVILCAASDAPDTDFTASIIDVYPDNRAVVLGPRVAGIVRARYRNRSSKAQLLKPGSVEKYCIDLGHIAHSFEPGHRIRVEISSSAAPFFNPNQNTGNSVVTDTEWRVAHQTVFHNAEHPSALILPLATPSCE